MNEWKLYIWTDVLPDYDTGIVFAVARSVDEALQTIEAQLQPYIRDEFRRNRESGMAKLEIKSLPAAGAQWGSA